jgi:hypothetical protein
LYKANVIADDDGCPDNSDTPVGAAATAATDDLHRYTNSESDRIPTTSMKMMTTLTSGVLLKIEVVIRPSFHKIKGEHTPLLPLSGGGYTPL